jgi:hypothetical protein
MHADLKESYLIGDAIKDGLAKAGDTEEERLNRMRTLL